MNIPKAKKRIEAGIAYLNVVKPDWLKKIDLEELDLADGNTCVIGEVFGDFWDYQDAKSVSKEQVTLADDTTFDIGNIGTDDLISLIESVYSELKNKKNK